VKFPRVIVRPVQEILFVDCASSVNNKTAVSFRFCLVVYMVFQKELYNFDSLYKFTQKNTPSSFWDCYGSM
jgi:hypothetical protein